MTLIGRTVKPRDRCHFAYYRNYWQIGKMQNSNAENANNEARMLC